MNVSESLEYTFTMPEFDYELVAVFDIDFNDADEGLEVPDKTALSNYPNPFNPETTRMLIPILPMI